MLQTHSLRDLVDQRPRRPVRSHRLRRHSRLGPAAAATGLACRSFHALVPALRHALPEIPAIEATNTPTGTRQPKQLPWHPG